MEQKYVAEKEYGEIIDVPFPVVDPLGDSGYIITLAEEHVQKIYALSEGQNAVVHIMGEMTLSFALVNRLLEDGYTCVASTSERIVNYKDDGTKEVVFRFKQFRDYK
jgi:hypothetical protein